MLRLLILSLSLCVFPFNSYALPVYSGPADAKGNPRYLVRVFDCSNGSYDGRENFTACDRATATITPQYLSTTGTALPASYNAAVTTIKEVVVPTNVENENPAALKSITIDVGALGTAQFFADQDFDGQSVLASPIPGPGILQTTYIDVICLKAHKSPLLRFTDGPDEMGNPEQTVFSLYFAATEGNLPKFKSFLSDDLAAKVDEGTMAKFAKDYRLYKDVTINPRTEFEIPGNYKVTGSPTTTRLSTEGSVRHTGFLGFGMKEVKLRNFTVSCEHNGNHAVDGCTVDEISGI